MRNIGIMLALIYAYQASVLPDFPVMGVRLYQIALLLGVLATFILEGADNTSIGNTRFMPMSMMFIALTLPSVFCSEHVQHSTMRWIGFALLVGLVGPVLLTPRLAALRDGAWHAVLGFSVLVGVVAIPWWILGLPNLGRAGVFGGMVDHSMLLGPIAAFGTMVVMAPLIQGQGVKPGRVALALMGALACLLAASRSALLSLVVGFMVMVVFARRGRRMDFVLMWSTPALLLVAIVAVSPAKVNAPERFYERVIRRGVSTASRDNLWSERIAEFQKSPVVGVGFQVTDAEGFTPGSAIEPGSSYLLIASSTGLVGVFGFLLLCGGYWKVLTNARFRAHPDAPLLLGLAALFLCHQVFEGYIFSVGQILTLMFWLVLGRILDLGAARPPAFAQAQPIAAFTTNDRN